jgi:hypothetical protein
MVAIQDLGPTYGPERRPPASKILRGRRSDYRFRPMELITILNRCHRFRGFVCQQAHFSADKKSIEVAVRPRKGFASARLRSTL